MQPQIFAHAHDFVELFGSRPGAGRLADAFQRPDGAIG
jgi:hypothetical protein